MFAGQLPVGNPSDARYVLPLVDKVQTALTHVTLRPPPALHSRAGDLALNDAKLRETLHARHLLTVGIPARLNRSRLRRALRLSTRGSPPQAWHRKRSPRQLQLACAAGYRRPVVESLIASLLSRGAAQLRYKGWHGARGQFSMAVMAHNAATVRRLRSVA